jgi:transposase
MLCIVPSVGSKTAMHHISQRWDGCGSFESHLFSIEPHKCLRQSVLCQSVDAHGVGHLTALTFVLTLGRKERFGRSRDVGCYLGLRPRRSQSGDHDPQLGITHAGNAYPRSLLIECSNHILRRKDETRPHGSGACA